MTDPNRFLLMLSPRFARTRLAMVMAVGLLGCATAQAATFGHARIVSSPGDPLMIMVPVSALGPADAQSLSAHPAPADQWAQAGMTPPVALESLRVSIDPGLQGDRRVLRVSSAQTFAGPLADLLLDVQTASGQQRYQVSLVTGARSPARAPVSGGATAAGDSNAAGNAPTQGSRAATISVQRGDTLFAIARQHAVQGVTIYQLMMALQRANPQAFIHQNINLVKAGAQLTMPGMDELLAISDREARRQFLAQVAAFQAMRGPQTSVSTPAVQASGGASQGQVSSAPTPGTAQAPTAEGGDRLRLGAGGDGSAQDAADAAADTRTSRQLAQSDAQGRVNQLESNVRHLSEALQGQGEAARSAVVEGAKGIGDSIASVAEAISDAGKAEQAAADARQPGSPAGAAGVSGTGSASGSSTAQGGVSAGAAAAARSGSGSTAGAAPGTASSAQGTSGAAPDDAAGAAGSVAQAGTSATQAGTSTAQAGTTAPQAGASGTQAEIAASQTGTATSPAQAHANSAGGSGAAGAATSAGTPPASTGTPSSTSGVSDASAASGASGASNAAGASGAPGAAASAGSTPGVKPDGVSRSADPLAVETSPEAAARAAQTEAQAAERSKGVVSWLQEHLLIVMTALLAFIVFVIAWLLRRAGSTRDEAYDAAQATEARVREKLKEIDLELQPSQDEPPTGTR